MLDSTWVFPSDLYVVDYVVYLLFYHHRPNLPPRASICHSLSVGVNLVQLCMAMFAWHPRVCPGQSTMLVLGYYYVTIADEYNSSV